MSTIKNTIRERSLMGWRWFEARAHGSHATFWLCFASFSEATLFLITPEVLLIPMLLAGAHRWVYFSTLTTIFSVLGGIAGYIIGAFFFDIIGIRLVDLYSLQDEIAQAGRLFNGHTFWVIFMAAFTPVPYKVFVFAAGFFKINFLSFVVASILGRGLRFFLIGYVVMRWREPMLRILFRYIAIATIVLLVALAVWLFIQLDGIEYIRAL